MWRLPCLTLVLLLPVAAGCHAPANAPADVPADADAAADVAIDQTDAQSADAEVLALSACGSDADCAALNFTPCRTVTCDPASHACKVTVASDGGGCQADGVCGGAGTCKSGSCSAATTCVPAACNAKPLACGQEQTVDLASLAKSTLKGYGNCSPLNWDGPEMVFSLTATTATRVTVSATASALDTKFGLFDIHGGQDGQCDGMTCDNAGVDSLVLGLPANGARFIVLDTRGANSGTITVSLACAAPAYCGDHKCSTGETCSNCVKDCGACKVTTCGNGACDAAENCVTCPADCNCPSGCAHSVNAGCGGCGCEDCVCKGTVNDGYCCSIGWDDLCVQECAACTSSTCPPWKDVCGDGLCAAGEYLTCKDDCIDWEQWCGDGICGGSDSEDCSQCPQDCGFCAGAIVPFGCGDGWCAGGETCATCPGDCGTCGDYGCACKANPACCATTFDFACQTACLACAGGACPLAACGDGVCAGETKASCPADCGL